MTLWVRKSDQAQWGWLTSGPHGVVWGRSPGAERCKMASLMCLGHRCWLMTGVPIFSSQCPFSLHVVSHHSVVMFTLRQLALQRNWKSSYSPEVTQCYLTNILLIKVNHLDLSRGKTDSTPWLAEYHGCAGSHFLVAIFCWNDPTVACS